MRAGEVLGPDSVPSLLVGSEVTDVIVPVYGGADDTRRCLAALYACSLRSAFEIVVVDDCSPDAGLSAWLDAQAATGRITLLRNEVNRGFVASVNRGMRLHPERDVVLLNSDAEVAGDWLDRMRACAYGAADVGTVTPFSNNATICSYPFEGWPGEVPGTLGLGGLDALVAKVNAGRVVELPTAVGFCMFIRRACLAAVGAFDEARFGRGYGEENDFSRRALAQGWRNLLCADVFVYHHGGVSFGETRAAQMNAAAEVLRALHPDYDEVVRRFIVRDPVAPLRAALGRARAALGGTEFAAVVEENALAVEIRRAQGRRLREPLPVKLHITHKWGGGIERWVQDFCAADLSARNLVLRGRTSRNETAFQLELVDPQLGQTPLRIWELNEPVFGTSIEHAEYREVLHWVCDAFAVRTIFVSSLIGHALEVFDTGLPTVLVMHDLYPFCPALFAWYGKPCRHCGEAELGQCLDSNPHNVFWHVTDRVRWLRVREAFAARMHVAGLTVVAPSQDVYARYAALFPPLKERPWALVPHGLGAAMAGARQAQPTVRAISARLRVLVPGSLLPHKGMGLLEAIYAELSGFADLILLGCGDFGMAFEGLPGVELVRDYEISELPAWVATLQPDCALLLSILPESFSYVMSEMNALAVPVVATRMGAFAERIHDGVDGFLVEPEPAAVLALLRTLAADRQTLQRVVRGLRVAPLRTAFEMVADYDALLPDHWRSTGGAASVEGAIQALAERVFLQQAVSQLHDELGVALSERARLQADVHAHALIVKDREAYIGEQLARVAALEVERDALFNSWSWRVARPLRMLERLWRRRPAAKVTVQRAVAAEAEERDVAEFAKEPTEDVALVATRVDIAGQAESMRAPERPSPISRHAARHAIRERLGLPDSARVVGGAGGSEAWSRFIALARVTTARDTRTSFVWLGESPDADASIEGGGRVSAAELMESMRDLFVVDEPPIALWARGIDLYCSGGDDAAWPAAVEEMGVPQLSLSEMGFEPNAWRVKLQEMLS